MRYGYWELRMISARSAGSRYRHNSVARKRNPMAILIWLCCILVVWLDCCKCDDYYDCLNYCIEAVLLANLI
jgi:hypothetical protein